MRPLQGMTITEKVSRWACQGECLAIGLAGRIAADLGATVLKIEPPEGDPLRTRSPLVGGVGALFAFLNAGKKSVVLRDADSAVLSRLIGRSNALIADRAGGADYGASIGSGLPAENATALVSISMLGPRSPQHVPASEFTVMALGGVLDMVGDPEREPLRLGGHQAAYSAGLAAFSGLAAALCLPVGSGEHRNPPEIVDVSLLETAIWLNWKTVATAAIGGQVPSRSRQTSDWPIIRCADGWIALVYLDGDWQRLRQLTKDDVRLADPALATASGRLGRNAEIAAVVEEHLLGLNRRQIHDLALEMRLPLGPVFTLDEFAEDPHIVARDFFKMITTESDTEIAMPRLPLLWDGEGFAPGRVPGLGIHGEVFA